MVRWEYRWLKVDVNRFLSPSDKAITEDITGTLNELGESGFELVSTLPLTSGHGTTCTVVFYFKRPRQDVAG